MYKIFDSKITPFGGISLLHQQLISSGAIAFINDQLGHRGHRAQYNYSDLLLSRIYTAFCGGDATEDVNYIREHTLEALGAINIPSADTILRGDVELSTCCETLATDSPLGNKVNINSKMNDFLVASAVKFEQLNPEDKSLIYDFDHQFIPAEKYDAQYSYKKSRGYFPAVATINNVPVYIEGRNGNCSVKTEQLSTHKRALETLSKQGIKPKYARMDCGSYIKEVADYFHDERILFSIRAAQSHTLLSTAVEANNWQPCSMATQEMEVTSFPYLFGKHTHRIIAYRFPNKTGEMSLFTQDANSYLFIITNDWETSEKDAIIFYNKRGEAEKVFDIQNNDFNWKAMPHSFLEENTVYLIIMAFAHILYRFLLNRLAGRVDGITKTSRLKKFIFRFVAMVAKYTRSGRRTIIQYATKNRELIEFINSS